jgi:hypothetical protein
MTAACLVIIKMRCAICMIDLSLAKAICTEGRRYMILQPEFDYLLMANNPSNGNRSSAHGVPFPSQTYNQQ